ncbi:MAG: hypothetical protein ABSB09_06095 [Acidimicrobiales bacterium]
MAPFRGGAVDGEGWSGASGGISPGQRHGGCGSLRRILHRHDPGVDPAARSDEGQGPDAEHRDAGP